MLLQFLAAVFFMFSANALPVQETIWDVKAKAWITPNQMAGQFLPGHVVVLGEQHATDQNMGDIDLLQHHDNHIRLMNLVAQEGKTVSVGLEFVAYTAQQSLDDLLAGRITQADFKNLVGWNDNTFPIYFEKMQAPAASGGNALGLNIPRRIARQVSQHGPNSLSPADRELVPASWEWGTPTYFERFSETMIGHVPAEKIRNYFWAQTLWDDTMAWRTANFMSANPNHVFHVVVGAFHAEFKDGLPARMTRLGIKNVKVVLQESVENWDLAELKKRTVPDTKYGQRADFLWFYTTKP